VTEVLARRHFQTPPPEFIFEKRGLNSNLRFKNKMLWAATLLRTVFALSLAIQRRPDELVP